MIKLVRDFFLLTYKQKRNIWKRFTKSRQRIWTVVKPSRTLRGAVLDQDDFTPDRSFVNARVCLTDNNTIEIEYVAFVKIRENASEFVSR